MTMTPRQARHHALIAREAAHAAGQVALKGFRSHARIERKQGAELVTPLDFAAEDALRKSLQSADPTIPIVAEEGGGSASHDRYWCADPIDGTTNFAHGHPFWAVSIALIEQGVPVAGAVVAPALDIEWIGWEGGLTLRNGEPCSVSDRSSIDDALLATGFPYDRQTSPDNNIREFAYLQKRAVGIRRCGSAAIDLCFVSDGSYDGYWEKKLRPWDIAAGVVMVRAAGGMATALDGQPDNVLDGHIVATNGHLHARLVELLRQSRQSTDW